MLRFQQFALCFKFLHPAEFHVIGMDVVYKIEGVGSPSGTPKKTVRISKSGELTNA